MKNINILGKKIKNSWLMFMDIDNLSNFIK